MITEKMVRVAVKAFREGRNHGDPAGMCAALEAVTPMILAEAAKVAEKMGIIADGYEAAAAIRALATQSPPPTE